MYNVHVHYTCTLIKNEEERGGERERERERERGREGGNKKQLSWSTLSSGRHKQEDSLFEEMLQVSQAIVSVSLD